MEDNSTDIRGGSGMQMAEGTTTQPATGGYGPPGTTEQPAFLPNEPSSKLIVHNVPLDSNFRELKEVCQEFDPYVKVFPDQRTNQTSQFGIMNFPDEASSRQAMERLNGMELRGNTLSARYGNANRDDDRNRGRGGFDRGRGRGGFGRGRGDRGRGRGFGRGVGGSRGAPTGLSSQLSPRHIRIHGLDGYYDWRVLKDTLAEKCKTEIKFCQQTEEGVVVEFHDMRDAEQASHDFNNGMPLFNQRVSAIQGDADSERSRETRSRRSRSPARRSRSPDRRRSGNGRSRDRSPRDRSRSRSRSRRGTASKSKSRSPHRAPSRENFAQPRQSYMEQLPPPNAPQGPENETFYERLVIETADGREREIFRQVSASQLGVAPAAPPVQAPPVQASRPVAQDHGDNRWGGATRSPSHREHSNSRGYRNGYERRGSSREHRDERRERDYRR